MKQRFAATAKLCVSGSIDILSAAFYICLMSLLPFSNYCKNFVTASIALLLLNACSTTGASDVAFKDITAIHRKDLTASALPETNTPMKPISKQLNVQFTSRDFKNSAAWIPEVFLCENSKIRLELASDVSIYNVDNITYKFYFKPFVVSSNKVEPLTPSDSVCFQLRNLGRVFTRTSNTVEIPKNQLNQAMTLTVQ